LLSRLKKIIPKAKIDHRWSGQVICTPDGLPYIGENAEHQFVATGYCGNGITFGTVGAMMARDWIVGRKNPWTELFAADRKKVKGATWNYIRENKDYPYYMIRDRFAGTEGKSLRGVPRGAGKVIDLNGQTAAVYRAPDGSTTKVSAICTHMACTVDWNEAEKTWDCPCHGSRFKTGGKVIAGPAESPLSRLD
jgi:Rieske Fe-S protein